MKRKMRSLGLGGWAAAAIFAGLAAGGAASPSGKTAIVCFLEGKAWTGEQGRGDRREVRLFDWFGAEDRLETGPDARLIVAFSSGSRFELGESTAVILKENGFASQKGSVRKLESVPVMPQLASIAAESKRGSRLGGIRLRTLQRTISGLYPNEGEAALADSVVLVFDPLEGVEKYGVEVEDGRGNCVFSTETATTRIAVSPGILKQGTGYYWQVRTLGEAQPSTVSYAAFVTVSEEQARLRNAFKSQVERSKDAANILLLAQMEISMGLRREACETLREALRIFPGNAEIENAIVQIGCK
jgi:hypothetical protein